MKEISKKTWLISILVICGLLSGAFDLFGIPNIFQLTRIIIDLPPSIQKVLLCVVTSIVFLGSLFFYDKRNNYPRWVSLISFIGIFSPLIIGSIYLGSSYYYYPPSDKVIILIADFDGPEKKKYRVTGNIKDQLERAIKKYPDIKIELLNESITYENENDYAKKIGKDRRASIVLWGEYSVNEENVQLIVHFEVLNKPYFLELKTETTIHKVEVAQLRNFTIQEQLSDEMTYLVLFTLGLARNEVGDFKKSVELFTEEIYINRGTAYCVCGEIELCMSDFNTAIEINPRSATAYLNRGNAYFLQNRIDLAISDYSKAIEINPNGDALYYYNRGIAYAHKCDFHYAISDFSRAIEIEPNKPIFYYNRGLAYSENNNLEASIEDYNKAIELGPGFFAAYNNRAIAFLQKNDFDSAISDFDMAIQLKPGFVIAYNNRGSAHLKNNAPDLAISDFNKAIEIDPNNAEAYYNRGNTYLYRNYGYE